jgi:hypothetical protein
MDDLDLKFPLLRSTGFRPTSPATKDYNCIAWAAEISNKWWWPTKGGWWPPGTARARTVDCFVKAFGTRGYIKCEDGSFEAGFVKVALYAKDGIPTHAARQLSSGKWTSKLGESFDIEHDIVEGVTGPVYGTVSRFLKKPLPKPEIEGEPK